MVHVLWLHQHAVLWHAALQVTMEEAEQLLRDVVFDEWRKSNCESFADTLKLTSLIDVFLPYLPLDRSHMPALMQLTLQQRSRILARKKVVLQWHPAVVQLLADKVRTVWVSAPDRSSCHGLRQ